MKVLAEARQGPSWDHVFGTDKLGRDQLSRVLYGLRVSPLDAELGFLLQAAARQRKNPFGEVMVVDPDYQAVIRNLRVHLRDQNYIGVDPRQLQDLKLERY